MNGRPKILGSELVIDSFISVKKERLLYPNQHERDYYTVQSAPESVACLAISSNDEILITHEYRHAIGAEVLSCPGGLVEPGEAILDAAKRELLEETGCLATHFEIIGCAYPLPGILNQKMYIVLAKEVTHHLLPNSDPTELIRSTFIPKETLRSQLATDPHVDGILCTALYFYTQRA